MPRQRRSTATLLLAGLSLAWVGLCGTSHAQPMQLPGAQPFNPAGTQQSAPGAAGAHAAPRPKAVPVLKVPTEETILGKTLRRNGGAGEATLEKTASGFALRLKAEGYQAANLTEPCAISFGENPVPATPVGKPNGLLRYKLEAPACPIVFDVLDGAVLVVEPSEPCVIEAAACRIEMRGLWGPDVRTLASRAKEIESERGRAETAVREGYRALTAKASALEQRSITREQAGFSSERTQICRDFQREGALGFCSARITEARAASLRQRLGLPEPKAEAAKPRPPRPAAPRPVAPSAAQGGGPLQLQ